VEQDVVEHAAQEVLGGGVGGRHLHGLRDGDAEAGRAGRVRRLPCFSRVLLVPREICIC
jgi:hypothetical protein